MIIPEELIELADSFLDELNSEVNSMREALAAFKKQYSDADEYTLVRSILHIEQLAHRYRLRVKDFFIK